MTHDVEVAIVAEEVIIEVMTDEGAKHGDKWKERTVGRYLFHAHDHLSECMCGEELEYHLRHALTDLAIAVTLLERGTTQ